MFAVTCARPPLGRHRPGGRLAGLTHRTQLLTPSRRSGASPLCAASSPGGFLADIYAANDKIRQRVSALASTDFQADLTWSEVAATRSRAEDVDLASVPGTQAFKERLQDTAVRLSGAHGADHVVFVKWRSETAAADGVARTTLYNVGFKPPELNAEFVKQAKHAEATAVGGFRILGHAVTAADMTAERGFRFYVPIPPGWTDEELMSAMVMQGGLNLDHLRHFGVDSRRNSAEVSTPSGDLFFNFAPAGCIGHGREDLAPIKQPPGRMFVLHPVTGVENHLRIRKAGACPHCWKPGVIGRHTDCAFSAVCRVCNIPWNEMPEEGKRHACGQGHLSKPTPYRPPQPVNPGEVPAEAPPLLFSGSQTPDLHGRYDR